MSKCWANYIQLQISIHFERKFFLQMNIYSHTNDLPHINFKKKNNTKWAKTNKWIASMSVDYSFVRKFAAWKIGNKFFSLGVGYSHKWDSFCGVCVVKFKQKAIWFFFFLFFSVVYAFLCLILWWIQVSLHRKWFIGS